MSHKPARCVTMTSHQYLGLMVFITVQNNSKVSLISKLNKFSCKKDHPPQRVVRRQFISLIMFECHWVSPVIVCEQWLSLKLPPPLSLSLYIYIYIYIYVCVLPPLSVRDLYVNACTCTCCMRARAPARVNTHTQRRYNAQAGRSPFDVVPFCRYLDDNSGDTWPTKRVLKAPSCPFINVT